MSAIRSLVLLLAAHVVLTACAGPGTGRDATQGSRPSASAQPVRLHVAIVGDPVVVFPSVDLRQASAIDELEHLVNAGLSVLDAEREPRAQLAEALPSVENGLWRVFPDGRMETTWHIREGATWHDGEPWTVSDLLFT